MRISTNQNTHNEQDGRCGRPRLLKLYQPSPSYEGTDPAWAPRYYFNSTLPFHLYLNYHWSTWISRKNFNNLSELRWKCPYQHACAQPHQICYDLNLLWYSHTLYSSNICEILLYNGQLVVLLISWYTLFGLLTARGKIIMKQDYCWPVMYMVFRRARYSPGSFVLNGAWSGTYQWSPNSIESIWGNDWRKGHHMSYNHRWHCNLRSLQTRVIRVVTGSIW